MRVIYVGRLIEAKGVQDLIRVCNGAWNTHDFKLAIVGDGPYRLALEDMVRLSCRQHVTFTGELPRSGVFRELRQSDIFVNPSYSEGLPTSVQEAMIVGLPIIATDVGGTREAITHGVSGLLYPPRNVDLLSIHLSALIDTPMLRQMLGQNAKRDAAKFDWAGIVDQYERMLNTVVPVSNRYKVKEGEHERNPI